MNRSEHINELAAALAKAQGAMTGAVKSANNPHFRSQYSDLASVTDAIREPLSANGLSYVQGLGQYIEGLITMTTTLMHSSGQWIETTSSLPVSGKTLNAQAVGSATTYLRRYALQALIGLPSVDDDGNAASDGPSAASKPADAVVNPGQYLAIDKALKVCPDGTEAKLLKALNVPNIAQIPASRYDWLMQRLKEKAEA